MEQTLTVARATLRRARLLGGDDGRGRGRGRGHQAAALQLLRQQGRPLHRLHGAGGRRALGDDRGLRRRRDHARRRRCAPAATPSSPSSTPTAPPGRSSSTRPCPRAGEIAERVAAYRGQILDLVTASIMGQVPPAMRRRGEGRGRGTLRGPARRRRGARPLVAADRGALRRGGRRPADRDDRARPRACAGPPSPARRLRKPDRKAAASDRQDPDGSP